MRRKLKRFWEEWGINKEEFGMFLGACGAIMIPILLSIVGGIFL